MSPGEGQKPSPNTGNINTAMKYAVSPHRTFFFKGKEYSANTVISEALQKEIGKETVENMVVDETFLPMEAFVPEPEGKKGNWGKWNLDPEVLAKMSLEALNMKVKEIDGSVEPFETVEEAVAQLSADWQAA